MKKTIVFLSICIQMLLLSSTVFSVPLLNQSNQHDQQSVITVDYHFSKPNISTITADDTKYARVTIDSLANMDDPGAPQLPVKGAYVLLPPNTNVDSIRIETSTKKIIRLSHPVIPSSVPIPRDNIITSKPIPLQKNNDIYQHDDPYPLDIYNKVNSYLMKGYQILVLQLHPVQYYPTQNTIDYYRSMTLTINVEPKQSDATVRPSVIDKEIIKNKVDNPVIIQSYKNNVEPYSSEPYDLLILTHESLQSGFQLLKQYHDTNGIITKIVTIDEIDENISSGNTPEDMRAFIKNEYETAGIQYVLLGGDIELVPSKILYVNGLDEEEYYLETTLPADFYFSCLDGPFNSDNDFRWGEPTDGENGSDVDLFSEVYVGRAACDTLEDVERFVNKTILYDSLDPSNPDLKKILMVGERLGDYGIASWGGNYLDLLLNESDADGYTTQGIPTTLFDIIKLYDRDDPREYWLPEDLISIINDNVHIINHDGHSSYTYNMKLVNYQTNEMNNTIPFFTYSVGCMAGGFDNPRGYDCFAEYVTVKVDHAAFAALMNARYGFFWSYSTDGDSTRYAREFWDAVFGENIPFISRAHQDSQEDNIHLIDRSCMRWIFYGLNYFGDPSISFKIGQKPTNPQLTGPSEVKVNETAHFTVYSTDVDSEEIYYFFQWGDGNHSEWLGPYPAGVPVNVSYEWQKKGTYEIQVKAKDDQGFESGWSHLDMNVPLIHKQRTIIQLFLDILKFIQIVI